MLSNGWSAKLTEVLEAPATDKALLPTADTDDVPLPDPEALLPDEEAIGPLEEEGRAPPGATPSSYRTSSERIGFEQMEANAADCGGSAGVELDGGGVGATVRGDFPAREKARRFTYSSRK